MTDIIEQWALYLTLKDKERFDQLTLEQKLEALRIAAIQKHETNH